MVRNYFKIICIFTTAKDQTISFAATHLALIIEHFQSLSPLHLKIFKIWLTFYFLLNILKIQTYKYQNVRISVKFCIYLGCMKWISSGCNNCLLYITSRWSPCIRYILLYIQTWNSVYNFREPKSRIIPLPQNII